MNRILLSFFLCLFFTNIGFSQSLGDYRSVKSGNWIDLSSWQYYNGSGWVTPSTTQGYPGQNNGTGAVAILGGHTITIGDGIGAGFSTLPMGTVTITGQLYLNGDKNSTPKFELDTQLVYVTPDTGTIKFNDKADLWIESTASQKTAVLIVNQNLNTNPKYYSIIGDCSNNQDIHFSPRFVSFCKGGGTGINFDDLMSVGGSLNAVVAPVTPVCEGGTINLNGSYTGAAGAAGVTYTWYLVNGTTETQFGTGTTASISNAVAGTYTIKLTCGTNYVNTDFYNSEIIKVVVNQKPAITSPATGSVCSGVSYSSGAIASTGTTFDWTRAVVTGISNTAGSGTGVANATGITETLTNTTTSAINVTYVLTPKSASGCSGNPFNLVVTVNPTPAITAPTTGLVCSGVSYSSGAITSTGTTFDWTRAVVAGISNTAGSGTGVANATGITETLTNATTSAINVTYILTPKSASSCPGSTFNLVVTVNPRPAITAPATGSVCSGVSYTSGAITSTGTTFDWTRAVVTGISNTAGSGTGVANATGITETLTNTTTSAINVTYILTPKLASGCSGNPFNLVVTVNPTPALTGAAQSTTACAGSGAVINLTGLLASSTSTINYTINGATQSAITGVIADTSGKGSFTTAALTAVNNGQILKITGVTTSSTIPSCSSVFALNVSLSVNQSPSGLSYTASTSVYCANTTISANNASLSTPGNSPITYTVNPALPAGLSINSSTGAITGTPTVATTATDYTVTATNSCGTATKVLNITVSGALPSIGGISLNGSSPYSSGSSASYCPLSNAVLSITPVTNASSYNWVLPAGWVVVSGQGTTSLTVKTGNSSQSGIVVINASNAGCGTTSSNLNIDLSNPTVVAPTVTLTQQPTCVVPKGTITVNFPTPSAGIVYTVTGTNPVVAAVSNTSGVFAGLTIGDYAVTYQMNSGCVSAPTSQVVTSSLVNTLSASGWSKGSLPTSSDIAVFAKNYTLSSSSVLSVCSCQINPNVDVVVALDAILKIENDLNVLGTGTITFENNASLVQVNDAAVNSGIINYKRISAPMKNFDFTYWSSPVQDQVLNVLSPNTLSDKYFSFANGNWVYENGGSKMNPAAKGFIIRVPKPNSNYPNKKDYWTTSTYSQPVEFIGKPNNGIIKITNQGAGMDNLIGNPYPSPIDADAFINANSALIGGALYFWTHNTAIKQNGQFYDYSSSDYATYTLTGGTKTSRGNVIIDVNKNGEYDDGDTTDDSNRPNGKIAAGQSFFVTSSATAIATDKFVFNNGMRISTSGNNAQFFKMSQTKKTAAIEKNRVWLNLSNSDGAFKQLLVGYITGATNEMDNLYDGISFDGNDYVDFYSVNKGNKFTIQGRALPFDKGDKVPLGYKTTVQGTFKISIDKVDGVLSNQTVFLEDNVTKSVHNLTDGSYSFTTAKGTFDNRFTLVYVDKNAPVVIVPPVTVDPPVVVNPPVVVDPPVVVTPPVAGLDPTIEKPAENENKSLVVSVKNHQIKINTFDKTINIVLLYDLRGREIFEKNNVKSNEYIIQGLNSSDQFLIVMVQLTDGKWVTKEIIFKN